MDGQDDESDKGRDDEEDSDEAQAEADKRVAQMLQNQQQYLHMCSSSAHILQLLSHLVPAISGQVMGLENVTEDSEEATSRSDSASSSHSPATSDDNTGCVLWAEPIMTCQLTPSWKPFCGDVRRLPPGVKPEDLKSQHIPTCGAFNNRSYHSAAAAAAAADAAARSRCQFAANRNNGGALAGNVNPGSVSKDTNSYTSPKESDPNPAATQRCRNEMDSKHCVLQDKMPKSSQLSNIQMMRTSAGYTPKVPNAADAIRRTKSILAAVTSGRQANNNNNPEQASDGKGRNQESVTTRPANGGSDKHTSGDSGINRSARSCNAENHACSAGTSAKGPEDASVKAQKDKSTETHFPAPILVKAAGVQADILQTQFKETEDGTDTINVTETVSYAGNPNCSGSDSNVYEICEKTSQTDAFNSQSPTVRTSEVADRSASNERILWGRMAARTDTSRLIRRPRPNGQLYRHPVSTYALQPRNRTQHSVSLGCQPEKRIVPPPVNLSPGTQPVKSATNEQLGLDFSLVNIAQNTQRPTRKHIITLAHLKNALQIAMRNLQKINKWTVEANSLRKEPIPHSRSTVSTFTMTEVESLNISTDHAEKDSMTSETVEPIVSEMVYDRTDIVDINGSGDATHTNADSITEVESLHCVQHCSPNELCNNLEVCTESPGLSCNDREERASDRNRTNSSCLRQKDVLVCSGGSSDVCVSREDPPGSCSPVSKKYPDYVTAEASGQQKQQLNNCHTEAPFVSTETTTADDAPVKENGVTTKYFNGEPRSQEEFNQIETIARDTIVLHPIHNSDKTLARHSQSNTQWKEDAIVHKSNRLNLSWTFSRAKFTEHSIPGTQLNDGAKPSRPYSTGEKKTQEGDNDLNNVVVVKNRDDFPPHFPEAGDTVENITILENIKNNPYGSHNLGVINNETQENSNPKTTEDSRKGDNKLHRRRNLQKVAKRLVFIQTGKSNNASQERGNTTFRTASENDDLLVPTLVQSKIHETHPIVTEDSADDVSESKVKHENQTRVSSLKDRNCNITLKASVKHKCAENDDIKIQRHRYSCERNQQDNSSSISDQSYSLVSLPHETRVFSEPKKDVSLNTIEKSANMTASETPRSASDSLVRSHRRKRGRISKLKHAREHRSKRDCKPAEGITSSNVILSKSNSTQYIDMIPGFMPSENIQSRQKLPGQSTRNILILSELKDISTINYKPKEKFSENLDKELELAETQASIQVSSAMAEKGSPDSSKSSSTRTSSVTHDAAVAPALAASSAVNTPLTAPLLDEEPPGLPGGLKSRLRRFFSQCLHPFSHRN